MRRWLAAVACIVFWNATVLAADDTSIWGDLKPGPNPVGFEVREERDVSRVDRPPRTLEGSLQAAPISRRLEIMMWYPARSADASRRMRFRDYLAYVDDIVDARSEDRNTVGDIEKRQRMGLHSMATFGTFADVPESQWTPLLDSPMHAVSEARPASGRFPLVLFAPGAYLTAAFNADSGEYLASHGYVVLSVPSRGSDAFNDRLSGGAFYESQLRDLEYLIDYASRLEFADIHRIGVIGYSRGGAAAVILAAKNPSINAIVSWDADAFENKQAAERLRESPFYDPDRITIPILHVRAGNPGTPPPLFESLRYAPRYVVNVDGIFHLDFSVIAMIHSAFALHNQYITLPPAKTRAAHASINTITREFLDAFVKTDGAFAGDARVAELQPAGMFSLARSEAVAAPPSSALLLERILSSNGVTSAREHIMRARQSSPGWRPFPESVLNGISDRMIELARGAEAVQVMMLNAELYPQSATVWARLGSAQEREGNVSAATQSYGKALELDPKNEAASAALKRLGKQD